jgi:hypothetical protein
VTHLTTRQSAAFPTVAILRKGGPKVKKEGKEAMGADLNDRFRVDWLPGVDPEVKKLFEAIYHTDQPHTLRAMIAFPNVFQAWDNTNEAYWGTSRFAHADNERYLFLFNPFTWQPIIEHGEPFKPFIPGEALMFENKQGEQKAFKLKSTTRFDLFLPELVGVFVTFQIKTNASGDLINLRRNLAAIQAAADALGQHTGAAGIPIIVSRREDVVQWHKAPGQTVPVKKWLIDIRPDAASKWAQTFAERLAALALAMPLSVEEDPAGDVDLVGGEDGEGTEPANLSAPAPSPSHLPVETSAEAETLAEAPAGPSEKTVDPLRPKAANDYSTFWVVVVPKLAEANKHIPGATFKGLAKAAMDESGNDAIAAYELLRQKIEAVEQPA